MSRQIVLDTETTGLSAEGGDRIIELGCVELVNRKLTGNNLHLYLNPERDSHEDALKVHGISNEFLRDKPKFAERVQDILQYLQGAELMLLGYNTPTHIPWTPIYDHLTDFHSQLCVQAGAYQNSMWVVAVAKAGMEEGEELAGGSVIVAPSGEIVAKAITSGDEVIVARCDLDISRHNREEMFNFALHRRVEHYGLITSQTGIQSE